MCGIFGIIIKPGFPIPINSVRKTLYRLAILSESRGKDSSGIAFRTESDQTIDVIKGDIPIWQLLKNSNFNLHLKKSLDSYRQGNGFAAFGHARLVTNGSQLQEVNNQPVIKDGILVIHNGIIVNAEELWQQNSDLQRNYLIDSEIIASLLGKEIQQENNLSNACNKTFNQLEGTYSVAAMFQDHDQFVLATNNGSLYYLSDNNNFIVFASEKYFLERLKHTPSFNAFNNKTVVQQIMNKSGLIINLKTLIIRDLNRPHIEKLYPSISYQIHKFTLANIKSQNEVVIDPSVYINCSEGSHSFNKLEYNIDAIQNLKRCTKCLLPESFPFIEYDNQGVCNYCRNYQPKNKDKQIDLLKTLVEPYRLEKGKSNCIVPFSGGRDSTYTLHFVKKALGLNPIAFTYDWGMVTDLARRNAARICGKLGVEHIIVAADIRLKRKNIRKNIIAWLKDPHLGMINSSFIMLTKS